MKRFLSLVLIIGVATIGAFLVRHSVAAEDSVPMTEAHIARIKSNCVEAQATLYRLHASDALLRVNRGQLYESISTKLMTPFNSRVTLNKLDNVSLVSIAVTYEHQLNDFRSNYQQYEEAMSQVMKINCNNQPVAFYDGVNDTNEKRTRVHDSTTLLQKTMKDYKDEFEAFAKHFQETHP